MTDSSATPSLRPSILIDPTKNAGGGDQRPNLVIVSLPQKLERTEKPVTLSGEVVETKPDGTIRIRTESGDIVAKPERPLPVVVGEDVEIRLPKGEPPATASLRSAPPERPAPVTPPPQTMPVKLPQTVTIRELIQTIETITLKTLPPQQIAKIMVPYLEIIKSELPASLQTRPPQTILPAPLLAPDLPPPQQPVTTPPPTQVAAALLIPQILAAVTEQDAVLITPAQGLLDFLKAQTETPTQTQPATNLEKSKLIPQLIDLPPRELLTKIITQPLLAPITTPKSVTPDPLLGLALRPAMTQSFEIITITPPPVMIQTSATADITNTPTPIATDIIPSFPPLTPMPKIDTAQATVVGYTPEQNFPILQIPAPDNRPQFFVLEQPIKDIPLGTQIELRPILTPSLPSTTPVITAPPTLIAAPMLSLTYFLTPEGWGTLQEIHSVLTQISPPLAQNFTNQLPQAASPPQLGPAALFFLAALRSGDITGWLGERAVDALKKAGKADLISRLNGEIGSLSRLSAEAVSQDWRLATLPLVYQNEIQKLVIHYKKDGREQTEDKKNGGGVRFLMNLSLSNIGPLQLDGLFRADQKRLDLMLRTRTNFSTPMQTEMQNLYKNALAESGFTGELAFQTKPEHWVHITPDNRAAFSEKI